MITSDDIARATAAYKGPVTRFPPRVAFGGGSFQLNLEAQGEGATDLPAWDTGAQITRDVARANAIRERALALLRQGATPRSVGVQLRVSIRKLTRWAVDSGLSDELALTRAKGRKEYEAGRKIQRAQRVAETVALKAAGLTDAQVAARMCVAVSTIERYISRHRKEARDAA